MVEVSIEFCIGRDFSSDIFLVQVPLQNLLIFFEIMFGRYILRDTVDGKNPAPIGVPEKFLKLL